MTCVETWHAMIAATPAMQLLELDWEAKLNAPALLRWQQGDDVFYAIAVTTPASGSFGTHAYDVYPNDAWGWVLDPHRRHGSVAFAGTSYIRPVRDVLNDLCRVALHRAQAPTP